MNTEEKPMYKWQEIPWRKLERRVFKLQTRIYRASQRDDVKTVHRLQKMLIKSWSAKCMAVRKVTQDNQGRKTGGVDGIKSLTPKARLELVNNLKLNRKAKPVRRVWIPKPGKTEKRPLGIPIMYDRAAQALVKMAIEPEWEAKFEKNSYGFRPGRSCHDAIQAIFATIKQKSKYVLDADIAQCFDQINHQKLLEKLQCPPTIRRSIRAWLKAGIMEKGNLFPTTSGTPQGGTVSPLLANVALHGLEEFIVNSFPMKQKRIEGKVKIIRYQPNVVRYADDFVVFHENLEVIEQIQLRIQEWLSDIGLELKPSKTKVTHTSQGFEFLGFNVRQYSVGKHNSGKLWNGRKLGFKTLMKPSKEKVKIHYRKICEIIESHKNAPQEALISKLNPIIRGWCNYYSAVVSGKTFGNLTNLIFWKLLSWAKHRHPNKSVKWIVRKYWNNWQFQTKDENYVLIKHSQIPIVRFVKVKENRSPYDGDLVYWSTRMGKHPEMPNGISKLLKKQKGKCNICELTFKDGDKIERDHIVPLKAGGHKYKDNLQILHRHCHDKKTKEDLVVIKRYKVKK